MDHTGSFARRYARTLQEVADELHLTRNQVITAERNALKKIAREAKTLAIMQSLSMTIEHHDEQRLSFPKGIRNVHRI